MSVTLRVDPNPCNRYRWPATPCRGTNSGAHVCMYPGGHDGGCKCFYCDKRSTGKDVADALTQTEEVDNGR